MNNIDKIKSKHDISLLIKRSLKQIKRDINDQDLLEKVKKNKRFKSFSVSGLTISWNIVWFVLRTFTAHGSREITLRDKS